MISEIQTIANALSGGFTFGHGERSWQNLQSDEAELPALYLDQPITENWSFPASGGYQIDAPVTILFLDKSELDWTPAQHAVVIAAMKAQVAEFVARVQADYSVFFSITGVKTVEVINLFDSNMSGVIMTCNIKLAVQSNCLPS